MPATRSTAPASLTMRELMALAREKLGADAARYKTRQELLVALGLDAAQQPADQQPGEAREAGEARGGSRGRRPSEAREDEDDALVVRDFFVDPTRPG